MVLLLLVPALWALAYFRAKLPVWTAVTALILVIQTLVSRPPGRFMLIVWVAFLAATVILNVSVLRILFISRPILSLFRRKLPSISPTESVALEAGTVWSGR